MNTTAASMLAQCEADAAAYASRVAGTPAASAVQNLAHIGGLTGLVRRLSDEIAAFMRPGKVDPDLEYVEVQTDQLGRVVVGLIYSPAMLRTEFEPGQDEGVEIREVWKGGDEISQGITQQACDDLERMAQFVIRAEVLRKKGYFND